MALDGTLGERRRAVRQPRRALRWLTLARLWPARRVRVLDWSATGMLIEGGVRFAPGRTVTLQLLGERGHLLVRGEITRAAVSAIGSTGLRYRAAVAFEKPVDLREPREAALGPDPQVARPTEGG